jgi:hypothetical protein
VEDISKVVRHRHHHRLLPLPPMVERKVGKLRDAMNNQVR